MNTRPSEGKVRVASMPTAVDFADAVRTEQHPTLPRVDGEVHVGDDDATVAPEFDVVELEDGVGHE